MKIHQIALLAIAVVSVALFTGCSTAGGAPFGGDTPVNGWAYKDASSASQNLAVSTDPSASATKMGQASATSILGMVGTGDASLSAAMQAGGITKIHHVDHHVMNILGLYGKFTLKVYGE